MKDTFFSTLTATHATGRPASARLSGRELIPPTGVPSGRRRGRRWQSGKAYKALSGSPRRAFRRERAAGCDAPPRRALLSRAPDTPRTGGAPRGTAREPSATDARSVSSTQGHGRSGCSAGPRPWRAPRRSARSSASCIRGARKGEVVCLALTILRVLWSTLYNAHLGTLFKSHDLSLTLIFLTQSTILC